MNKDKEKTKLELQNKELEKLVNSINKAGVLIKESKSVVINFELQKKICKLF